MNGAETTAQIMTAIAAVIVALALAAIAAAVWRYLEAHAPEPKHRAPRWPDAPAHGDWREDPLGFSQDPGPVPGALREDPATLERMYVIQHPEAAEPREHVHDFYGAPCWCGWGEPIGSKATSRERPYSAAATWPRPPEPIASAETVLTETVVLGD